MPNGSIFTPLWEGMSSGQIAVVVIVLLNVLFWVCVVPAMVLSLIVVVVYRGVFGLPTVTWRGVAQPDQVAELVLKAAGGELPEEDNESGILRRMH